MAENYAEKLNDGAEKAAERADLKSLEKKTPEVKLSKAEMAREEKELAKSGEAAEKKISAEKEKQELDLSKAKEKESEKVEKKQPQVRLPKSYSKAEKQTVYKRQIKNVQAQLPRGSRAFSKVIHNRAVEAVSDATGKTIFRPSVLVGGAVVGLAAGATVYIVARLYDFSMPNWILPVLLIAGAILGLIAEFIVSRFRHQPEV